MKKFKYLIVENIDKEFLQESLNDFGEDGWECFEIKNCYNEKTGDSVTVYLKREADDSQSGNLMIKYVVKEQSW